MTRIHEQERTLYGEISATLAERLPEVDVLAVELLGPDRFCVFVDTPAGVDHAVCERVTNVLRGYLDRYTVDVSSPGFDRPVRTREHFAGPKGSASPSGRSMRSAAASGSGARSPRPATRRLRSWAPPGGSRSPTTRSCGET